MLCSAHLIQFVSQDLSLHLIQAALRYGILEKLTCGENKTTQ